MNDVDAGRRSYLGGDSDATALITVVRRYPAAERPARFGTPSAASRLISAQSSKVITPNRLGASLFERHYGLVFDRRRHARSRITLAPASTRTEVTTQPATCRRSAPNNN